MTGFFFKLQAYHPANGKSSDKPLLAPLFLGKLREIQSPVPQSREIFSDWGAVVTMIVVCIVLAGLYFYLIRRTESKSRRPLIEKADRESLLLWMSAPEEQSSPGDAKLAASPTGAKQWRDD